MKRKVVSGTMLTLLTIVVASAGMMPLVSAQPQVQVWNLEIKRYSVHFISRTRGLV